MGNPDGAPNVTVTAVKVSCFLLVALPLAALCLPAHSQESQPPSSSSDSDNVLQEITVTASRRSQTEQRVPIALTAVGADQLAREGITTATQLGQLAPNLYVLGSVSEGSPRMSIRGLTETDTQPAGSPAVATYIDDVYQAFQFGIAASLFDLQRVEVLRGPQGTTFGKNTTGGAVAYFSQEPVDRVEGYVSGRVAGGDQPQRFIEAAVNVPLIDGTLALRFSGRMDDKSHWVYDQANKRGRGAGNGQSGRFQLGWTPASATKVNLTVFSSSWNGDEPPGHAQILPAPVDPVVIRLSPYNLYDNFNNDGVTLRVQQELGLFNLTAISHYRRSDYSTSQDLDGSAEDIFLYTSHSIAKQYGQEIRLASDHTLRLSGILGAYYEHDRVNEVANESATLEADYNNLAHYSTRTETYAGFGNLTVKLTDSLAVVGGVRKTVETRSVDGRKLYFLSGNYPWTQGNMVFDGPPPTAPDQDLSYPLRIKSKPWTWDGTLNYNPKSSLLLFARVAQGFRSGGFNPGATTFVLPAPTPLPYQGESVRSYEVGIKSTLLEMLRVNATVFHYDYSNQQVTGYVTGDNALPIEITDNAGKSKVDGGELELMASSGMHWQFRGSASYTNARYTQYVDPGFFDYTGNRLQQAPEWTANVSVGYTTPISATFDLRATTVWSYRSRIFFDSPNDPYMSDNAVAKGSLRVGLEPSQGKGLAVTGFVDNLTNKRPLAAGFTFLPGSYYIKYFETGRLYGVDLSYHW